MSRFDPEGLVSRPLGGMVEFQDRPVVLQDEIVVRVLILAADGVDATRAAAGFGLLLSCLSGALLRAQTVPTPESVLGFPVLSGFLLGRST